MTMADPLQMTLLARLNTWRRGLHDWLHADLTTPGNRRKARIYTLWYDHELVRIPWSNFARVAEGVYRSNQPTKARFRRWQRKLGLKTVLSLRGQTGAPPILEEEAICAELGLRLESCALSARQAPPRERILELIALFPRLEKPFLMHCKSGADRASLASAIYLLTQENASVEEAQKMLSPRFVHLKFTRTGILDHILEAYAARNAASPIAFADWIAQDYDAAALQAEFDTKRGRA